MAIVNYHVDRSATGPLFDGSIGDPFLTLQSALLDSAVQANSGNDIIINCTDGGESSKDVTDIGNAISSAIVCLSLTIRGDGVDSDGFKTDKYTLSIVDNEVIYIRNIDADFYLEDIQLELIAPGTGNHLLITTTSIVAGRQQFLKNIRGIIDASASTGGIKSGVGAFTANVDMVANNVLIDVIGGGSATTQGFDRTAGTLKVYGSLADGADVGFDGDIDTVKNCAAPNCVDSFNVTGTLENCAGEQAEAGVTQVSDWTTEFEDIGAKDYTLKVTSSILKDGGQNVSAENGNVTEDMDGNPRGAIWDIGPSEEATPSITITSPDSIVAESAAQLGGTLLDTAISVGLETIDEVYSKTGTIDAQTPTTLDFDAGTGWQEATVSVDVAGVPLTADVLAVGVTVYSHRVFVSNGTLKTTRNITLPVASGYQVVQTMIAEANVTAGEGIFDPAIIAVEDNMQAIVPTQVSGVNILVNAAGELIVDADQTLNFPIVYFSPSTGQYSVVNHTWEASAGATGPTSTTLGSVETYTLTGLTNPATATYNGVSVSVDNASFPDVDVTFMDFAGLVGTDIALDTPQTLRFDDGTNTVDISVTLAKDAANFQVTYAPPPAVGSIGETETGAVAGDVFLIRDNGGTITNFATDTELTFSGTDYDYDYIWYDVSATTWSTITNNSFTAPTVVGPASTTLGDIENYSLTGMSNPVTAIYNGVAVTVNNAAFPSIAVSFPSFNQLVGTDIALDTPQTLRFDDGTNTVDISVTLAKDAANFQVTYAPPPAVGSIGETETGAVAGDVFLIRDNGGTIANFATDTELTFSGTDYDYDYIWYDVSTTTWSTITNNSFTEAGENIMTVSTAVDNSAVGRIIGINTKFKNLRNNSVLFLPQRIAVVGQGATASSYVTTKREVTSALEVAQLYGYGSPLHLAVNQLLPANGLGVGNIPVTVYPLQDDPSGVAATGSITPSGSITEATAYRVSVNNILSEQFVVSPGDSVADIVTAVTNAMNAVLDLPVTAVDNTTVVDLTAKWEGVSSNDVNVEIIGSQSVGVSYAVVQPTGGLVNPDVDVALNQIGNVRETLLLNCMDIADTASLDKYNTFGVGRWGALVRKPIMVFTGNTITSMATATTVSDGRKTDYVNGQLVAPGSDDLPFVVAAAQLVRIAMVANNNPPQDYGSQQASTLTPGADGDQWLYTVRDAAVKNGSSTVEIKDGVVNISDVVTFYHPDGDPIPAYRYAVDIVKLQNIIYNIDLEFEKVEWAGAPLIPDNQPTVNRSAKTPKAAVAAIASIIDNLALNAIISDPESAKNSIQAAINPQNPKRLDLAVTVKLSGNTNVISIDLNFGFFFGTPQVVS